MRLSIFALALVCLAVAVNAQHENAAVNPVMINELNSMEGMTWKAGVNPFFEGKSLDEVRRLLGVAPSHLEENAAKAKAIAAETKTASVSAFHHRNVALPESFSWLEKNPACMPPVLDQGHCGSCYSFGVAEAMSSRFCIESQGRVNVTLSPQKIVSCAHVGANGCNGGQPRLVYDFVELSGLMSMDCTPYTAGKGDVEACMHDKCTQAGADATVYKAKMFSARSYHSLESMKEAIMEGPVTGTFSVYEDFMNYKSGVYQHKSGKFLGGHAIMCFGWGVENGVEYIECRNSWTAQWGDNGNFKIAAHDCGISHGASAAKPAL